MPKYRKINDVWSLYQYGDKYKAVYIKAATRRLPENPPLFPEFKGMTEQEKRWFLGRSMSFFYEHLGDNWEPHESIPEKSADRESTEERLSASISRTKSRIYELALCNEFTFFGTFTQNEKKVGNRFDLTAFRKDLSQYIRNQNRNRSDCSKIQYLLIPEQHKDGAWHMHGMLSGLQIGSDLRLFSMREKLPQKIRESLKKGEKIYNWDGYSSKFGYFTATEIKSKAAVSAYITKYVTKDVAKQSIEKGRHLFFASQGLKRREVIIKDGVDQANEIITCPFSDDEWEFENDYVKVKWIDANDVPKMGL